MKTPEHDESEKTEEDKYWDEVFASTRGGTGRLELESDVDECVEDSFEDSDLY